MRSFYIVLGIILFFALGAIFAPFLAPYPYQEQFKDYPLSPPTHIHFDKNGLFVYPLILQNQISFSYKEDRSKKCYIKFFKETGKGLELFYTDKKGCYLFLLGTDELGRDIFSRLLYALRVSLSISFSGAFTLLFLGTIIGSISGYFGGKVDNVLMRFSELFMSMPTFYLMLALRSVFPLEVSGTFVFFMIIFIISFFSWAGFARVIRGMVLSIRELDYIKASKIWGASPIYIIRKHIFPNIFPYVITSLALSIPSFIIAESSLSFLGLGVEEPYPSLGNMLSSIKNIYKGTNYPWLFSPALCLFLIIIAFNTIGDYFQSKIKKED